MNPSILLVEDDINLGYILREYLELSSFSVTWAKDGAEGLKHLECKDFRLMIADVMMPGMDGFEVARKAKEKKNVPVIFLTAKSLLVDKLKGFKIGAEDYIVKPVAEEELIARIHVILKRTNAVSKTDSSRETFSIGKYQFDPLNQKLMIGKEEITLTTKESDLLKMLCQHPDVILNRKEALGKLWGTVDYFSRRNMDVFITRLRKHLSLDPSIKIMNIHGKGFLLKINP
jgi:DNA-binding response OmpR family regulator